MSVTTVSRVLNNRGYISDNIREKVYQAMKELDYQPNEIARSLFRRKSNIIGFILPTVAHPFFGELTSYIEYYAYNQNYKILLCNSHMDKNKERDYIDMLKRNQVDGIIMGSHTLAQGKDMESNEAFLSSLKEGKVDLANNKAFIGLLETFDVMKQYNIDKNDPLKGNVETGPQVIGEGKVGLWFMGNWAWTQISEYDPNGEYGFIPVPISNDANDLGNSQVVKWASKYVSLDVEQSTQEEQAAARKFLEWLVYTESGQNSLIDKCNVMAAFKNVTKAPDNPLARSLKKYIDSGDTMEYISTLPSDHWSEVGASMQKYLSDMVDKTELAKEIENYWKNVE